MGAGGNAAQSIAYVPGEKEECRGENAQKCREKCREMEKKSDITFPEL